MYTLLGGVIDTVLGWIIKSITDRSNDYKYYKKKLVYELKREAYSELYKKMR